MIKLFEDHFLKHTHIFEISIINYNNKNILIMKYQNDKKSIHLIYNKSFIEFRHRIFL